MDPIRFAIENPVKIAVGVILLLVFGLISLAVIAVQLTPNVDQPVISVNTRWEGASPQEIEQDVILEQEDKLKDVRGLKKMTSQSQQSQGQIILEFPVGTEMGRALIDVSNKLRQVPDYPDNVDEPVVEASDPRNRDYIAWVILSTEDPTFDVRGLQKWAEDHVKTRFERIEGISEVNVLGGSEPEVRVVVDPRRMAQYGLTADRLAQVLRSRNINVSAGDLSEQKYEPRLRTKGRYESIEEVERTVVSGPGEPVVRVMDFGRAELTYKEPTAMVRSKGDVALAINAQREVGTNVMRIMTDFRAEIEKLNNSILPAKSKELGLQSPLTLEQVYDQTVYIDQAFLLVRNNLFVGGTLAVLVLLMFLRSVRPTVIVALAIPISIIGTFVALVAMGRNINVISLAGLAFAVGMVVDNAIVVLENIDRQLRLGKSRGRASYDGAKEVWGAILASTLTTLAVFVPVLTVQEEAGQLFRDIALAICAAVTLSLIVSVMVIPTAAARFITRRDDGHEPAADPPDASNGSARSANAKTAAPRPLRRVSALAGAFVLKVRDLVYWACGTRIVRPAIVVGLAGLSVLASALLMPPATYLPTGNRNLVFGVLVPPPGYGLNKMAEIGQRVESVVEPYWEAEGDPEAAANLPPVEFMGQKVPVPPVSNFFFVGLETGIMFTGAISADQDLVDPVGMLLNSAIQPQPGILGGARKRALIQTGGEGQGIELELVGDDLGRIIAAAEALFPQLGAAFGFRNVRPSPGNFNLPAEEVQVRIDDVRAAEVDLPNDELALAVQVLGDGAIVDEYIYQGDGVDLKIIHNFAEYESALDVGHVQLANALGEPVPISSVADVVRTVAPQQINRIERQRSVSFQIDVPPEVPVDIAVQRIERQMLAPLERQGLIGPGVVEANLAGTAAKLATVKRAMLGEWTGFTLESLQTLFMSRAFLALLVVFLLMAALFESWLYPLVILFTVPLATVGGFLGLRAVHEWTAAMPFAETQQLDVLTMLGFVILIGIVVNNAILIVHQALNFMRGHGDVEGYEGQKLEPRHAIAESVRTRIRPVLMSTFTSVGGMLPLVLFPGAGSELYRGLGSVVVGGLLVAGVFTLLLTPLVMSLVFDLRKLFARGEEITI